jgi:prolyl-tRNA editing enzyme YbaK/EbsC (Cys-tRNA(Pro) deacylase)
MNLGQLAFQPTNNAPRLLAQTTLDALQTHTLESFVLVSEIDASFSDTAAFCEHYEIDASITANCVIIEAHRGDKTWYAACLILATTKADVNGAIRRELNARRASFAPMDTATMLSGMEYGGITPIGLPDNWPILIDTQVLAQNQIVIGSGIRSSKLLVQTHALAKLPSAKVLPIAK